MMSYRTILLWSMLAAALGPNAVSAAWVMPAGGTFAPIPLVLKSTVPPNVLFALSVEFPTAITAAYPGANDYSVNNTYLGYFDPNKCYDYTGNSTTSPYLPNANSWFHPVSAATAHACSGSWSGNFLNWATMTGLDEFRSAMTGGNRAVDTASTTVLERSYQSNQGSAGSNFTAKTFTGAGATPYSSTTALTINNWNQGVNMNVSTTALVGDVSCTSPTVSSGNFSCGALTLTQTGSSGACATWSGSGTSASPYQCSAFGAFDDNISVSSPALSITSTQVNNPSASDTVNCTGPTTSPSFSCAISLSSNSHTGSCTIWTGSGTNAAPYKCTAFGTFSGGESITSSTPATATTTTISGSATGSNPVTCASPSLSASGNFTCGSLTFGSDTGACSSYSGSGTTAAPYKCVSAGTFSGGEVFSSLSTNATATVTSAPVNATCTLSTNPSVAITCTLPNGSHGTCSTYSGNGTRTNRAYTCTAFNTFSGGESITAITPGTVSSASPYYYQNYSLTYNALYYKTYTGSYSGSIYYVPSYAVNQQTSYYYASSYHVNYAFPTTYAVRVKVCDGSLGSAVPVESNCTQYGSNYKPEGVIQANGQTMRFGMFSYFNGKYIDNAVMRSKAKYVAPMQWSQYYGAITNPAAEWSSSDGTFYTNPDSTVASASYPAAVSNSGVINYVNKFGSSSHSYKTYDDVGKLYYEALKYLRGLQPTTGFYSQATATSADGFPIITTWDDPFKDDATQTTAYSCRKNYIIAMGDTHTWCDKELPGGTYGSTGNSVCNATSAGGWSTVGASGDMGSLAGDSGVNVTTWTNALGAKEGSPSLATTLTGAGGASFYMSGLAYWANSQDIRPDIAGTQNAQTFVIDVEEKSGSQVDCGYNSQYWYAAKYGGADSFDVSGNPVNWSTQLSLTAGACGTRAPTWYSSTAPSTGAWPKNLLRGNDPAGMRASVNNALASISAQNGQVSALAQSSGNLINGGAYLFRASFATLGWTGDLSAYGINTAGGVGSTATWQASAHVPAAASRVIYTFNDGLDATGAVESSTYARKGVNFDQANFSTTPSYFSTRQQAFLNEDPVGSVDSHGSQRIAYLRGDQTNEAPNGFGWRARTSLLGDIINSNPKFVAAPTILSLPGSGYASFVQAVKNRTPMIYVGGNDGMLHGFDASAPGSSGHTPGTEMMAYVPSAVYNNLSRLMWPNYGHTYFVDGSPTVAEACFGTCGGQSDWKTVLASGLKAGGKGVFALDVTDPSHFDSSHAASTVLWEFTNMDDRDLGYTFSNPIVRLMNNGKWAVIFGNGFNNTQSTNAPGDRVSATGRAYLYIVYVDGPGSGATWASNPNYVKIELKSPSEPATASLPLSPANGLASIQSVDTNGDQKIDYIYAGDLQGNVWKIDVSSSTASNWKSAYQNSVGDPLPLFSATDGGSPGTPQPITSGFVVSRHPNGGYLVIFGTGAYIYQSDAYTSGQQSLYGIWDMDSASATLTGGATARVSRSQLQKQQQVSVSQSSGGNTFYLQSNCKPNYTTSSTAPPTGDGLSYDCPSAIVVGSPGNPPAVPPTAPPQQLGWVFDLPNTGERIIETNPQLSSGVLTVTTMGPSNSTDPCLGGSTGWMYALDYLSGGRTTGPVFTSSVGSTSPVVFSITSGSVTVSIYPSAIQLTGGASDTPAHFTMAPQQVIANSAQGTAAAAGGTPTTTTIGATFVPGLGIPYYLAGGSGKPCKGANCPPPAGASPNVWIPNNSSGVGTISQGALGRVSWRQLAQ